MSTNLKIIHILTGLGVGGAERLALNLAIAQSEKEKELDVSVLALNSDVRILEQYHNSSINIYSLGLFKSLKRVLEYLKKFRSCESDRIIIHAHMFHALLFAIFMKLLKWNVKIIFTSHNFGGFNLLRSLLVRLTVFFRHGDVLLGKGQHPWLNKNPRIIPNAVRMPAVINKPYEKKNSFCFVVVGRLDYVKNPLHILNSFIELNHLDASLTYVGDGPLRSDLESAITDLGLTSVTVLGNVDSLDAIYQQADCLVMASHWEGLPMVILEAGSYGVGVISSPVGAIPELLKSGRGFLVEPSDLPNAMTKVVKNPHLCRDAGQKLQSYIIDQFSLESSVESHLKFYKEVLDL